MRKYLLAVVLSGVPSTVHALMVGDDVLRATRAAGSLVGGGVREGVVVHLAVSAFWTVALTRLRVRGAVAGAVAGLLIAAGRVPEVPSGGSGGRGPRRRHRRPV
ncbi:hypothetical protein [Lentzea sp. NEAU-D7]|uniref:hypothetical protein n=1 Tax=Lentzea sp. NEAU-D7 TaxID=2994667 RepID=UPI00224A537B|nr:hypothetical protein [Lentzea sp. NEAU-D7]MCX2947752.1 hypothetical protein [Lentzea sp. NEAU-D7]